MRDTSGLKRGGSQVARKVSRTLSPSRPGPPARSSLTIPITGDRLKARLRAGRLPPALECLLWHYAKGKPKDDLQVTGNERGPLHHHPQALGG